MDIFTLRLQEVLKNGGFTQVYLADKIGISKQCINDFKAGRSFPSVQTLRELCKVLAVSADYLLGLTDY